VHDVVRESLRDGGGGAESGRDMGKRGVRIKGLQAIEREVMGGNFFFFFFL